MTPEKEQDFRGVSLKRQLVEEIERLIREYPQYKSIADFVHEAVRIRMEDIRKVKLPRFEQVNFDENGVKVLDREFHKVVQVYLKPEGIFCESCEKNDCEHIRFALSMPEVKKEIKKKQLEGWRLPDV